MSVIAFLLLLLMMPIYLPIILCMFVMFSCFSNGFGSRLVIRRFVFLLVVSMEKKMIDLTIILLSLGMILLMIASYCDKQHMVHYLFLIISFVCGLLAFTLSAMLLSGLVLMWRGT